MKKNLAILMLALATTLAGCGKSDKGDDNSGDDATNGTLTLDGATYNFKTANISVTTAGDYNVYALVFTNNSPLVSFGVGIYSGSIDLAGTYTIVDPLNMPLEHQAWAIGTLAIGTTVYNVQGGTATVSRSGDDWNVTVTGGRAAAGSGSTKSFTFSFTGKLKSI